MVRIQKPSNSGAEISSLNNINPESNKEECYGCILKVIKISIKHYFREPVNPVHIVKDKRL